MEFSSNFDVVPKLFSVAKTYVETNFQYFWLNEATVIVQMKWKIETK